MDWEQVLAQAGLVFLKEGLNFIFSNIKGKKAAQKAEKELEDRAQITASQTHDSEVTSISSKLQWDKVGALFWLGNDLMWIQDMMYRGALPERVLQGINHATHYVSELGFPADSLATQHLSLCSDIVKPLVGIRGSTESERNLLQQHYRTIEQYIQTVKWYLNALVKDKQPGFEKLRAL
jgi:hypothetical protein